MGLNDAFMVTQPAAIVASAVGNLFASMGSNGIIALSVVAREPAFMDTRQPVFPVAGIKFAYTKFKNLNASPVVAN